MTGCDGPGIDLARSVVDVLRVDRCTLRGPIDLDSARIEHGFGIHDSSLGDGARALRGCWLRANGLERLPTTGFRFTAAPPMVAGMGTFPVRAFAELTSSR